MQTNKSFNWKSMFIIFIVSASFAMYRSWTNKEGSTLKYEAGYSVLKSNELYSIALPSYLVETDKLHAEASMQYINEKKSLAFMVIDELKSNTIYGYEEYFEKMITRPQTNFSEFEIIERKDLNINNLSTKYILYKAIQNDKQMYCKMYLINGIETYYQVLASTLIPNNEYFKRDVDNAIYSFREKTKPNKPS